MMFRPCNRVFPTVLLRDHLWSVVCRIVSVLGYSLESRPLIFSFGQSQLAVRFFLPSTNGLTSNQRPTQRRKTWVLSAIELHYIIRETLDRIRIRHAHPNSIKCLRKWNRVLHTNLKAFSVWFNFLFFLGNVRLRGGFAFDLGCVA